MMIERVTQLDRKLWMDGIYTTYRPLYTSDGCEGLGKASYHTRTISSISSHWI